jgi:FkbM family methyltransferase|tara:strand:+ start:1284 stop:1901 length:618 start_codon:yes stop_codon:yes gene_type:complete
MEKIIHYYDLGLYSGGEVEMFIDICTRNNWDYRVYGVEAHPEYAQEVHDRYVNNSKVNIFNYAISENIEKIKLYLAHGNGGQGNSIFRTKNNVSDTHYEVQGIPFSTMLENYPDFNKQFNILRFNIEGAEWYMMNDLINNNLHKNFNIICGAGTDIHKVGELKPYLNQYNKLLEDNDIKVYRFCDISPEKNHDIENLIQTQLNNI